MEAEPGRHADAEGPLVLIRVVVGRRGPSLRTTEPALRGQRCGTTPCIGTPWTALFNAYVICTAAASRRHRRKQLYRAKTKRMKRSNTEAQEIRCALAGLPESMCAPGRAHGRVEEGVLPAPALRGVAVPSPRSGHNGASRPHGLQRAAEKSTLSTSSSMKLSNFAKIKLKIFQQEVAKSTLKFS